MEENKKEQEPDRPAIEISGSSFSPTNYSPPFRRGSEYCRLSLARDREGANAPSPSGSCYRRLADGTRATPRVRSLRRSADWRRPSDEQKRPEGKPTAEALPSSPREQSARQAPLSARESLGLSGGPNANDATRVTAVSSYNLLGDDLDVDVAHKVEDPAARASPCSARDAGNSPPYRRSRNGSGSSGCLQLDRIYFPKRRRRAVAYSPDPRETAEQKDDAFALAGSWPESSGSFVARTVGSSGSEAERPPPEVLFAHQKTDNSSSAGSANVVNRLTRVSCGHLAALAVSCVGIVVVFAILIAMFRASVRAETADCDRMAAAVRTRILGAISVLRGFSAFISAVGPSSINETAFRSYGDLSRTTDALYRVMWSPLVLEADRAQWEQKFNTQIWSLGPSRSERFSANHSQYYYPIERIYPPRNESVGFNVLSDTARLVALNEAISLGNWTFSNVADVDYGTQGVGVRVIYPFPSDGKRLFLGPGFTSGTLRGRDVVRGAVTDQDTELAARVVFRDYVVFNSRDPDSSGSASEPFMPQASFQYDKVILDVRGRADGTSPWVLQCRRYIRYVDANGWFVAVAAVFITVTSAFLANMFTERFLHARRTARLSAKEKKVMMLEFTRMQASANTILKAIADPLVVFDVYGRVRHYNKAAFDLFGHRPRLLGLTSSDLFSRPEFRSEKSETGVDDTDTSVSAMQTPESSLSLQSGSHRTGRPTFAVRQSLVDQIITAGGSSGDDVRCFIQGSGVRELLVRRCQGLPPLLAEANISNSESGDREAATIVVLRDITQQRANAEELKQAKLIAEKANTDKGMFLAFLCHELRNPLSVVAAATNFLGETELNAEQREYQTSLAFSAKVMLEIVNDVLDLERGLAAGPKAIEKIPFDIGELLEDVDSVHRVVVQSAKDKNLEWKMEYTSSLPRLVYGDPTKLRQCFSNLICNSIKFTNSGYIRCTVDAMRTPRVGFVNIRFTVQDTGIGITPDEVPNLLKPYSQANVSIGRNFGGSGLGLSITNNLLQSMGSNGLQIESDLGKGFKAWFDLHLEIVEDRANCLSHAKVARDILPGLPPITVVPEESIGEASHASTDGQNVSPAPSSPSLLDHVAPEAGDVPAPVAPFPASQVPAAPELPFDQSAPLTTGQACVPSMSPPGRSPAGSPSPRAARRPPESPPAHFSPGSAAKPVGRPVRVLLVEDNAMIQKMGVKMLKLEGFEPFTANNGLEAVHVMTSEQIDVCLMDLIMPEMDGFTATVEIRSKGIVVPIVALTANALVADRDRCFELGFTAFCTKPLSRTDMRYVVLRAYVDSKGTGGGFEKGSEKWKPSANIFWKQPKAAALRPEERPSP